MDPWLNYHVKMTELQSDAARQRLLAAVADESTRSRPSALARALAAIGRRLSSWGETLEAFDGHPSAVTRQDWPA